MADGTTGDAPPPSAQDGISGRYVTDDERLAALIKVARYFGRHKLKGYTASVMFAIERTNLIKKKCRLEDILAETGIDEADCRVALGQLIERKIVTQKVPTYGDPERVFYRIGPVGGKLVKALLNR